jgi:hypothetical protein
MESHYPLFTDKFLVAPLVRRRARQIQSQLFSQGPNIELPQQLKLTKST